MSQPNDGPQNYSNPTPSRDGSQVPLLQCQHCSQPRYFKGERGLNIHLGKIHNKRDVLVNNFQSSTAPLANSIDQIEPFWKTLTRLKHSVPVVKRIPRGARITVAQHLSKLIKNILQQNSESAWEQLFLFPYKILHSNNYRSGSLTSNLKNNCINAIDVDSNHLPKFKNTYNIFKVIEAKVGDGDLRGATNLLFSNDSVAPDSVETLTALKSKHPSCAGELHLPSSISNSLNLTDSCFQVTCKETCTAVMSFRSGSASGHDGLSPQHLKDLISSNTGDAGRVLLNDLTALVNLMLSGQVNERVIGILYGANLIALNKKDGGIRPIAVGCTLRRIASKACCKFIISDLIDKFEPHQLGFGIKGGCEAAVHAVRTFVGKNINEVLLKVDVKNAFNSVNRSAILNEIQKCTPKMYRYLLQCYGTPSKLLFRDNLLSSEVGCQQGDPLGPAIFSLAIHSIISSLKSKLNIWYLDDGTLGGEPDDVLADLTSIITKFESIGLELNFSKCELYIPPHFTPDTRNSIVNQFNSACPNIKVLDDSSLRILGAPILLDSFSLYINDQNSKFSEFSDRLLKINAHVAFHIIRFCMFVPKLTYVLRCTPLWQFPNMLETLDNTKNNLMSQILNCNLDERSSCQASLPIRLGGIGIRNISSVALPAFLSSAHSTCGLFKKIVADSLGDAQVLHMEEARNAWSLACPGETLPLNLNSQKLWDGPLCRIVQQNLLNSSTNPAERARLIATSQPESGFWLHALPSANIGTLMDTQSFSLAISLRLGCPTIEPHRCSCGVIVDQLGHHGLCCRRSAGRQSRHAALNDVIRRAFVTVNVPALLEPNGIARDDGRRPDGMTLIPWGRGRPLVWDATCVDTLAPSHLPGTSRTAGAAAGAAEDLKRRKYAAITGNCTFVPFAVETMGPWGPQAHKLFRELSTRLVEVTGDQKAGSYLGHRISLAIQRGNAASLLGTAPEGSNLDSVFYL